MQQYFIDAVESDIFALDEKDYHHIVNVMRLEVGNNLRVAISNEQSIFFCEIIEITSSQVIVKKLEKLEETRELHQNVTFAVGLLRHQNFELIIQKLTELGVSSIIPWEAKFSVAKLKDKAVDKKLERWHKIAQEASEQSKRLIIPHITHPMNTKELVNTLDSYDHVLIASETLTQEVAAKMILNIDLTGANILVVIGPEGGISPEEHALFAQTNHVTFISLGSRILRAETAAISAMSVLAAKIEQ